jgi:hypothetical protein
MRRVNDPRREPAPDDDESAAADRADVQAAPSDACDASLFASADGTTRREFIKRVGLAGALAGLPLFGPDARADGGLVPRGERRPPPRRLYTCETMFFNLSHLRGSFTSHYLYLAGRKYRLVATEEAPEVLAAARYSNAFLRAMPDGAITHHLEAALAPQDSAALCYWTSNENKVSGTWAMTGMHIHIPVTSLPQTYEQLRHMVPDGPLPLSNKRRMYGIAAAASLQDLYDEAVLVDVNKFAEALVGVHPDLMAIEPGAASRIHAKYISVDANTQFLAGLLQTMGPAMPQGSIATTGATPWATLIPMIDEKTGKSLKKSDNLLNQYYPDWNPQVDQNMAPAVGSIHPLVKNDSVLGIDITGYNLNNPNNHPPPLQAKGKLWGRRDGVATVQQLANAAASAGPTMTFTNQSAETGLAVTSPSIFTAPDGRIAITLDELSNWFLRWLGVWVQFVDPNGNVIPASALPVDTYPGERGPYPRSSDVPDAIFLGVVSPALTILGIPVNPGSFAPTIYVPKTAASMRIFYTGAGQSGSAPQQPTGIYTAGIAMTATFNYGVVGLFAAAGVSAFSPVFKLAVSLGGGAVAAAITTAIGGSLNNASFAKELASFTMNFMKVLLQAGSTRVISELWAAITLEIATAEAIDSVPVAGQIARAVAAVVGGIQLAETSLEIALSPAAYRFDCVATHNLSVTFLPDKNSAQFPQPPAGYLLYCKVSYLFDNGTAHTLPNVTINPTATSLPITFTAIPYGGQVNVSIGLYMRKSTTPEGRNDWCAGYATTGLVANDVDVIAPPNGLTGFRITEVKIPIQSTTRYIHTRKTAIDSVGAHYWLTDSDGTHAPPYVQPPGGQLPGLGGFDAITVRQATSEQAGYVGYAWKAFSSGVNGCGSSSPGQFDQMANLNTDAGNEGRNAQNGYINTQPLCGFEPGVRIGYNLLTHNSLNMYLDTTTLLIRPVDLDPPAFAKPGSNRAYGMLKLDSTRCLLHPAGFVVSINNAAHKIEALKLPLAPVSVQDAESYWVARSYSGVGTEPGLIASPIAAAISPDGAILVLEAGNNRIQAFDTGGNSVRYFKGQSADEHFLPLPATAGATYLDLAVEFSGYLYVLSMDANNRHRLDIYHPDQEGTAPICTTFDLNAARLTVDFWRSVYSLNYEVLKRPNGQIPSFTEPSVSLWVPPPPA